MTGLAPARKGGCLRRLLSGLLILMVATAAEARVFDQSQEKFGSYLRATAANWSNGDSPFSQSSGTGSTNFSSTYTLLPSYEFGFLYRTTPLVWRLGFEFLQPNSLTNVTGGTSSTPYFSLNSNLSVVAAKLELEFNLKQWKQSRVWLLGGAGAGFLTLDNSYTLTSAGTTQFPTVSNFKEEIKGQTLMYDMGLGFETLMSDTTTFFVEGGYRVMDFSNLSHNSAATTFQGAVTVGGSATTNSGAARDINLGTFYLGLGFRVWVF